MEPVRADLPRTLVRQCRRDSYPLVVESLARSERDEDPPAPCDVGGGELPEHGPWRGRLKSGPEIRSERVRERFLLGET
jgi:hypothetical protein